MYKNVNYTRLVTYICVMLKDYRLYKLNSPPEYSSLQQSAFTAVGTRMGSHCVTYHLAEVTFLPLPQLIKAGTRFSDPGGMQG